MTIEIVLQLAVLVSGMAVAGFCFLLSRRLRKLNDLETGLGGAIAVMAAEIARLESALALAQQGASQATNALTQEIDKARSERAQWALQRQFLPETTEPRRTVRRRRACETVDA